MKVMTMKLVRTDDSRILRGQNCALTPDRAVQRLLTVPR